MKIADIFQSYISTSNVTKFDNGLYFKEHIQITLKEYFDWIDAGLVSLNYEGNRPDVNQKDKQKGIIGSIPLDVDIGKISLRIMDTDGFKYPAVICDGGHRSRAFYDFVNGKFAMSDTAYYINMHGKKINLGGLTFSQIKKTHPDVGRFIEEFPLTITLFFNMTDEMFTIQFQSMNISTDVNGPERRNSHLANAIISFIRPNVRKIETLDNVPHKLFTPPGVATKKEERICSDVLDFPLGRLTYQLVLERMMYYISEGSCIVPCDDTILDQFYIDYGTEYNREGIWVRNQKAFDNVKRDTLKLCDFVHDVFKAWPLKSSGGTFLKRNETTMTALIRFVFSITSEVKENRWMIHSVDFDKFSRSFHDMIYNLLNLPKDKNPIGIWTSGEKTDRLKTEAFVGYLGEFKNVNKIQKSVDWIMEEFAGRYEDFGIHLIDSRESFSDADQKRRYDEVGGVCEVTGVAVDYSDIQGDHAIPRIKGVLKGGVTEYANLRILHKAINNHKGAREFDEYLKSGDWTTVELK